MDNRQNINRLPDVNETRFFSLAASEAQERGVRLMIESLRAFGGSLSKAPVWVFYWQGYRQDLDAAATIYADIGGVVCIALDLDDTVGSYMFGGKVSACAQAEALAGPEVGQIVWLASDFLTLNPPDLLSLGPDFDAAVRPVHVRNVGLQAEQPLDGYWGAIYQAVGMEDTTLAVEPFIDPHAIRPYFNSHVFAIDPTKGLMRRWLELFAALVADRTFQESACADQLHQIFLHQAIWSALLIKELDWSRIRLLPPSYSYPLIFHERVPSLARPETLNELVCIAYEDLNLHPESLQGIDVTEPLKSWLRARF